MSAASVIKTLRSQAPVIAPSMLKCDFGNLQREVSLLESAGAIVLHLDVMDGHFVPNISYGAMVVRGLRQLTPMTLDVHLMISHPEQYIDEFLDAGCECVTFHVECVAEPGRVLRRIRSSGAAAGIALNPKTPVERIEAVLPECDLVLVMSVEPGFGGQQFMPSVLEKLRHLRDLAGSETLLSIDGGIGPSTIAGAAEAGADLFVAGSAVFDSPDYRVAMEELHTIAASAYKTSPLER